MDRSQDQIFDELLVLFAQGGDADALEELVQRWIPRLSRHAAYMSSSAAAPDILQDALLAIARGIRSLDDPARFGAWAQRIVSNKCADWVRAQRQDRGRQSTQPLDAIDQRTERPSSADHVDAVREALRRLPPDRRALLALRYADGLTDTAIAEAMDIPVGTVKSRMHAAREELRAALDHQENRNGKA